MLIVKKSTYYGGYVERERKREKGLVDKEEELVYENWSEMEENFAFSYVYELKTFGRFEIRYSTGGHPMDRDTWDGVEVYELV